MLSNPLLDIAIGLIFLYLLLSIIITVIQEFIASTLKLRNKNLQQAVIELLGEGNRQAFFDHPLIAPLFQGELDDEGKPKRGGPSYIPKRNFALAVLDLKARHEVAVDPATRRLPPAFALAGFFDDEHSGIGLRQRVERFNRLADTVIAVIGNETVRTAATGALSAAVGEIKTSTDLVDTAVKELESLFDSTMDRASGWYKVNAQRLSFCIGLVVALLLNVDSIHVARELWRDDALRERAVAAAESYLTSEAGQRQFEAVCRAEATPEPESADAESPSTAPDNAESQEFQNCLRREITGALSQIDAAGFPIGWSGWTGWLPDLQSTQRSSTAILGMLITGLALSLGASFWFDLLGKFMKVRMTGKREPTGDSTGTVAA